MSQICANSARPLEAGGKRPEVVRKRITDAGRDALDRKWILSIRHKNKRAAKRSGGYKRWSYSPTCTDSKLITFEAPFEHGRSAQRQSGLLNL